MEPKYSVGISIESQNQAHVETFITLSTARNYIELCKKDGTRVLWLQNINTGREHRF